jgi:hypothetical protein
MLSHRSTGKVTRAQFLSALSTLPLSYGVFVSFSNKRRNFWPSCDARRVVESAKALMNLWRRLWKRHTKDT